MAPEDQVQPPPESIAREVQSVQQSAAPEDSQALVPVSRKGGISQLQLSDALKEIGQIRSEAAMMLLCSHASRLESDLREIKSEREKTQQACERWMLAYHDEKERGAVLSARLQGISNMKNLQKFTGAVGGIVAGVAIPFLIIGPSGWALGGALVGFLLLVAGFWPSNYRGLQK